MFADVTSFESDSSVWPIKTSYVEHTPMDAHIVRVNTSIDNFVPSTFSARSTYDRIGAVRDASALESAKLCMV